MLIKRLLIFFLSLLLFIDSRTLPLEAKNNSPSGKQTVQKQKPSAKRQSSKKASATTAQTLRKIRGVATSSRPLYKPKRMMRGKLANAGLVPHEVAAMLQGKTFRNFNHFRRELWIAISKTKYANEFNSSNKEMMARGKAPHADLSQQIGGQITYQLHHITPINRGGRVYDISNLAIVTPRFHREILDKRYHYGR